MPTPVLHKVGAEFDERNMFLQAALGLIAFLHRGRALLARYGTVERPRPMLRRAQHERIPSSISNDFSAPPAPTASNAPPAEDEHPFLYLVLGAIALSHHLLRHLPALRAPSSAQRPGTAPAPGAPATERSLRELLE